MPPAGQLCPLGYVVSAVIWSVSWMNGSPFAVVIVTVTCTGAVGRFGIVAKPCKPPVGTRVAEHEESPSSPGQVVALAVDDGAS